MRRTLVQIHLWLGLTIGLVWALQGLTGSALVFFREVHRMGLPTPTPGPMISLDTIVANASAAAGGARIVRLAVADPNRDLIYAYVESGSAESPAVLVDAATGRAVSLDKMMPRSPAGNSVMLWLDNLHISLLAGRNGEIFITVSGLVLVFATITGVWIGWPRRNWKGAFQVSRWRNLDQQLYGWHRVGGLVAGVLILLLSLSGAYFAFEPPVDAALARIFPFQRQYEPEPAASAPVENVRPQQVADAALARFPSGRWVRIYMPTAGSPVYRVRLHQPGESRVWLGKTFAWIDPANGSVVATYDPLNVPITNRLLDATFPLHNGELAGLPGRIVVLVSGLVLPALYITGVMAWYRKRKRRARAPALQALARG